MIYATLFKNIPIQSQFVERFVDGSEIIYRKISAGTAIVTSVKTNNRALECIRHTEQIRRISHNNAFPLLEDVLNEPPNTIQFPTND